jgi:hypothetical protein
MTPSPNQPTPRGPFYRSSQFAKPVTFAFILLCCLAAGLAGLFLARNTLNIGAFFPPTQTVPPPTPPCVQPKLQLGQASRTPGSA